MDADLTSFLKGPTPCVGVSVDHYARLLHECRCKTIGATQSFRVRFKIMVANWTPAALKQERVGPSAIAKTLGIGRASIYRALGEPTSEHHRYQRLSHVRF
jgi:hypothetical protein